MIVLFKLNNSYMKKCPKFIKVRILFYFFLILFPLTLKKQVVQKYARSVAKGLNHLILLRPASPTPSKNPASTAIAGIGFLITHAIFWVKI